MELSADDRDFITRVPIFAGLTPEALNKLAEISMRVGFDAEKQVYAEGEPAREMFIVLAGELEVRKESSSGKGVPIAMLTPGDVGGEMALIDIQPRSAAIFARKKTTLAVLTYADVAKLYETHPESYTILVLNIAREISRRLRRLDRLMADMMVEMQEILVTPGSTRDTGGPNG